MRHLLLSGWCSPFILAVALSQFAFAREFPAPSELPLQPGFPDPLVSFSGEKYSGKLSWELGRKPELFDLFARYMYGNMPPKPRGFRAKLEASYNDALGGKATLKLVSLRLGGEGAPIENLLILIPNSAKNPAPVFLGTDFNGNHEILPDRRIPLPSGWVPGNSKGTNNHRATDAERGRETDVWAVEATIDRGYAFAAFYNGDVEPDQNGSTEGIRAWTSKRGGEQYDWGAIAAWAWGFHRAIDYLAADKAIDSKRIAVVGHSRNGKAAMLAGATDPRVAMVIPLQAGCGGTAPSRSHLGESVKRINTSFPHWFNAAFKEFNDEPGRLPFDQHCLIALCAPRPVLLANAEEDSWANPPGQFEMLKLAAPVYQLYGQGALETDSMPPVNTLSPGRLGYYIRPGKHSMTTGDWKTFLDYADRWLK